MLLNTRSGVLLCGVLAVLANMLPLFLYETGGDYSLQYALIECYGRHVWQGDFYPRWCMEANAGYGSPLPVFYNLLPFYVTTIFYPLFWFGASFHQLFLIGVFLSGLLTFCGAYYWLRAMTANPFAAALAATLLLWLPYRMEMLAARAAFSELWAFALLPALFYYVRRQALQGGRWPQIAFILALALLCHPITAMFGMMMAGIYMLVVTRSPRQCLIICASAAAACMIAAFHWYPVKYLLQYTGEYNHGAMRRGWANDFADNQHYDAASFLWGEFPPIEWLRGWHVGVMLAAILLAAWLLRTSSDSLRKREVTAWGGIALLALFLFFSVSEPVWNIIEYFSHAIAPWRAALMGVCALAALLAVYLAACSRAVSVAILVVGMIAGSAIIQIPKPVPADLRQLIEVSRCVISYFNSFVWIDKRYYNDRNAFLQRFVMHRPQEQASLAAGTVSVTEWDAHRIALTAHALRPGYMTIEQFYFPSWHATVGGRPADLIPEENGTARMMLQLPAGTSDVVIVSDTAGILPPSYRWVCGLSLISLIAVLYAMVRTRKPHG